MIGVGSIGERHLRCLLATGRADVLLCDVNAALRARVAAQYGVQGVFADLDAALDAKPDAAVIATPAHLHVAQATLLAEAGLQLLIEKPLSTSLEGVPGLQEVVARRGTKVTLGYVLRFYPGILALREALLEDRFGRALQLICVTGQHFPTYRPAYREIYYNRRETGGGAIQDALTHLVNAGEWLVGPVQRVVADAAHQVLPGVEVEDTVGLLARHSTALGCYALNQHQAPNEFSLTIVCERGTLRYELHENRWRWMSEPGNAWHDEPIAPAERDTFFVAQANAFLDLLEGRREAACSLEEGCQTLRVNLAALASLQSGTWQDPRSQA